MYCIIYKSVHAKDKYESKKDILHEVQSSIEEGWVVQSEAAACKCTCAKERKGSGIGHLLFVSV